MNRGTSGKSPGCFVCWHTSYNVHSRINGLLVSGANKDHQGLAKLQRSQPWLEDQSGLLENARCAQGFPPGNSAGSHQCCPIWVAYWVQSWQCSYAAVQDSHSPLIHHGTWSVKDQTFAVISTAWMMFHIFTRLLCQGEAHLVLETALPAAAETFPSHGNSQLGIVSGFTHAIRGAQSG